MKSKKQLYYVVLVGRETGIYKKWKNADAQVNGFSNSEHYSFDSHPEAVKALRDRYGPDVDINFKDDDNPTPLF